MILLAISRETDKNNTLLCNIKSYSETSKAALEILDIHKTEIKESKRLQMSTSKDGVWAWQRYEKRSGSRTQHEVG
jgi:hypothetical protein